VSAATAAGARSSRRIGGALRDRLPELVLALGMFVCVALLLYLGRGRTFFFDEWSFVVDRSAGGPINGLDVLMVPHNEHWAALPIGFYRLCFELFGLDTTVPFRLATALLNAACAALVFVLARPRIGAWAALLPAFAVMFMGAANENLLWGFQIGFVGAIAAGLVALVALERGTRRGDVVACVALIASVMSQGTWVALWVCAAVVIALQRQWRRAWIVVIPAVVYGIWHVVYSNGAKHGSHTLDAPSWALDAAASTISGFFGDASNAYGHAGLVLVGALIVWHLTRQPPASPRFWGLLIGMAAFWLVVGQGRAGIISPNASRYIGASSFLVALIFVEIASRIDLGRREVLIGAVIVAIGIAAGLPELRDQARFYRGSSAEISAQLAALELLGENRVPRDLVFDSARAPALSAGSYLAAVRLNGSSPAMSATQLAADAGHTGRREADRVVYATGLLSATPAKSTPPPGAPACEVLEPGTAVKVRAGGGLYVRSERRAARNEVTVRRFYDQIVQPPVGTIGAGSSLLVRPPADASPLPYTFVINGDRPATVCTG